MEIMSKYAYGVTEAQVSVISGKIDLKSEKMQKKIVTTPILGDSSLFPIKTFPTQFFCILWQVMKRFTDKTTSCTHGSHTVDIVDCYFVKSEKIVTEK